MLTTLLPCVVNLSCTHPSRLLLGFTTETGHFFAIGLGSFDSCTMYWQSLDPPHFQSIGDNVEGDRIDYAYGAR